MPLFPDDINVMASDATAAASAGVDRAHAADLQSMRIALKEEPIFNQHTDSMWHTHWKGWGNGIVDSLSRDDLEMAFRIAHSFGIKLVEIDISTDMAVQHFMRRVLIRTRPDPPNAFHVFIKGVNGDTMSLVTGPDVTVGDLLERYTVEVNALALDCNLVKEGRVLDTATTMTAAGVGKDDTLHAVLRVRAGMRDVSEPPSPLVTRPRAARSADAHGSGENPRHAGAPPRG